MKKLTTKEYITKCKNVHGEKYDYSQTIYYGDKIPLKVICPIHGYFEQTPRVHLITKGCQQCSNKTLSEKTRKTLQQFIHDARMIHGEKYDYSKSVYITARTKIIVTCKIHGDFKVIPDAHLKGVNCKKCADKTNKQNQPRLTREELLARCKHIHGDKYTYNNLNEYQNTKQKMEIICNVHGPFYQRIDNHIHGKKGCILCNKYSNAETYIKRILLEQNIVFEHNKTFPDCKNNKTGRKLKFDFFLQHYNTIIEYDGSHHFKTNNYWLNHSVDEVQRRDKIKNIYCDQNNIRMIRISYMENLIEKLDEALTYLKTIN